MAPGNGPKFTPMGVPALLGGRLVQPTLTLSGLGRQTGGILLVRLSSGGSFKNAADRKKFDPAHPDDTTVAENIRQWWQLGPLVDQWSGTQCPAGQRPKVVAGLGGPVHRRYVVGALNIDSTGKWLADAYGFYEIPVTGETVDAHGNPWPTGCRCPIQLHNLRALHLGRRHRRRQVPTEAVAATSADLHL